MLSSNDDVANLGKGIYDILRKDRELKKGAAMMMTRKKKAKAKLMKIKKWREWLSGLARGGGEPHSSA